MPLTNFPNGITVEGETIRVSNTTTFSADMSSTTLNTIASHEIATVTGLVRMRIIPDVTEGLSGNTATIALGTADSTAEFIGATTASGLDTGEIWTTSTPGANNKSSVRFEKIPDFVISDADVGYTIAKSALITGTLVFRMFWEALEGATSTVTVGAGGTL